jgi:transcriptional regulator of met regulon
MSAPPGFNPDTSLLQQNSSAPIVPFRGGGTPLSLEAFYQAIVKRQSETIRKTLPESIADITNFAISVEDGKFVLKMKVKGKKKVTTDEENEEAIAAVAALEAANEANEVEEAIAAVAASEAEEEEILKKAREFLILEAARAFMRNLGNGKQSTPTPPRPTRPTRSLNEIAAASRATLIAEEAKRIVKELKRNALEQRGVVSPTKGRRGKFVTFSSQLPSATGAVATSKDVQEASALSKSITQAPEFSAVIEQ